MYNKLSKVRLLVKGLDYNLKYEVSEIACDLQSSLGLSRISFGSKEILRECIVLFQVHWTSGEGCDKPWLV